MYFEEFFLPKRFVFNVTSQHCGDSGYDEYINSNYRFCWYLKILNIFRISNTWQMKDAGKNIRHFQAVHLKYIQVIHYNYYTKKYMHEVKVQL